MAELYEQFEEWLRRDVDDSRVRYDAVEAGLDCRIDEAGRLGPLAYLKIHRDLPDDAWERIEDRLNRRIREYREYEEPVDECIALPRTLPEPRWEAVEEGLIERIGAMERAPAWERALKEEIIVPEGVWDRIENSLLTRIDIHEEHGAKRRISWPIMWTARSVFARVTLPLAAAVCIAFAAVAFRGYRSYRMPTYVIESWGANAEQLGFIRPDQRVFESSEGGGIRIANSHGFVDIQNGAAVEVERYGKASIRYRLAMTPAVSGDIGRGKATFFVNRHGESGVFIVETPHYHIEAVGTYFRVLPDVGGRMATEVYEGKVRVRLEDGELVSVASGESLVYDGRLGKYVVIGGGLVVDRKDIDIVPSLDSIGQYHTLAIASNLAYSEVSVDGKFRGMTPLRILVRPGEHRIAVSSGAYAAVDTVITVDRERFFYARFQQPASSGIPLHARASAPQKGEAAVRSGAAQVEERDALRGLPPAGAATELQTLNAREILAQAQKIESTDWRGALQRYRQVSVADNVAPIVKETALFSIGRLEAERSHNNAAAREAFLRYLALFPSGLFACESLLRLAEIEFSRDPDEAIAYYLKYFEQYPNHYRVAELQYRVGLIYLQRKRFDDAVTMLRRSLSSMYAADAELRGRALSALERALAGRESVAQAK